MKKRYFILGIIILILSTYCVDKKFFMKYRVLKHNLWEHHLGEKISGGDLRRIKWKRQLFPKSEHSYHSMWWSGSDGSEDHVRRRAERIHGQTGIKRRRRNGFQAGILVCGWTGPPAYIWTFTGNDLFYGWSGNLSGEKACIWDGICVHGGRLWRCRCSALGNKDHPGRRSGFLIRWNK